MARVLHISDLHLGQPADWQLLGEHKSKMAAGDQRAQKDVLRETLAALDEANELERLDAAVISGDLTNKAGADGFDEFESLLATLTKTLDPSKVLSGPWES